MRFGFRVHTLGCRLNQLESEAMIEKFEEAGLVATDGKADLNVVNSCTVTSKAEQKMRRMVRELSDSGICIVTGCAVKGDKASEIEQLSPNVIAVGIESKHRIMDFANYLKERLSECSESEAQLDLREEAFGFFGKDPTGTSEGDSVSRRFDFSPTKFHDHHKAYLKVQDGCDRHCTFCAVSISRGNPLSLAADEVVRRFELLQEAGYKEICLTGVNLALYDHGGDGLAGLLLRLESAVKPDVRVRLTSLEPDLIDEKLIDVLALPFICAYFHLPIQSASEKVLSLTGRKYDRCILEKIISGLRRVKSDPFISADIMTGLPGEDETEARITYDFLERMDLSFLHVFPFSKRKGTPAFDMKAPEQRVRDERALRLRDLSARLYRGYASGFLGETVSAIIESADGDGFLATSDNYLKIAVSAGSPLNLGSRCEVFIRRVVKDEKKGALVFGEVAAGLPDSSSV